MSALRQDSFPVQEEHSATPKHRRVRLTKRKRSNRLPLRRFALLLILMGTLLLMQLAGYALETNLSFQLEEREKNLAKSYASIERLRVDIQRENSLESLEARAVELGFKAATVDQYISIK